MLFRKRVAAAPGNERPCLSPDWVTVKILQKRIAVKPIGESYRAMSASALDDSDRSNFLLSGRGRKAPPRELINKLTCLMFRLIHLLLNFSELANMSFFLFD